MRWFCSCVHYYTSCFCLLLYQLYLSYQLSSGWPAPPGYRNRRCPPSERAAASNTSRSHRLLIYHPGLFWRYIVPTQCLYHMQGMFHTYMRLHEQATENVIENQSSMKPVSRLHSSLDSPTEHLLVCIIARDDKIM